MVRAALIAALAGFLAACTPPDRGEVNIYSARHYDVDDAVYRAFEDETGVRVNLIEADGALLLERMKAEGARSPADVIITVDAGMLWKFEEAGLFQPLASEKVHTAIPADLRHPDGLWFGLSSRARAIAYSRDRIDPATVSTYAALADPALRGRVCVRSSSNIYNLSLLAALIERWGPERAEDWARGVVANFARPPVGGDIDQIRAVAAGVCDVALTNHYYYARVAASQAPEDQAVEDAVGLLFPDQDGAGTHVNISGIGLAAHAPHPDQAREFIEFLLNPAQQTAFARANNEYPVTGAPLDNPTLKALGAFNAEPVNVAVYGRRQTEAARIFDAVGWP